MVVHIRTDRVFSRIASGCVPAIRNPPFCDGCPVVCSIGASRFASNVGEQQASAGRSAAECANWWERVFVRESGLIRRRHCRTGRVVCRPLAGAINADIRCRSVARPHLPSIVSFAKGCRRRDCGGPRESARSLRAPRSLGDCDRCRNIWCDRGDCWVHGHSCHIAGSSEPTDLAARPVQADQRTGSCTEQRPDAAFVAMASSGCGYRHDWVGIGSVGDAAVAWRRLACQRELYRSPDACRSHPALSLADWCGLSDDRYTSLAARPGSRSGRSDRRLGHLGVQISPAKLCGAWGCDCHGTRVPRNVCCCPSCALSLGLS